MGNWVLSVAVTFQWSVVTHVMPMPHSRSACLAPNSARVLCPETQADHQPQATRKHASNIQPGTPSATCCFCGTCLAPSAPHAAPTTQASLRRSPSPTTRLQRGMARSR